MTIRRGFFDHDDNRAITVRRWMIDATRDDDGDANLPAALLLAQIDFWLSPATRTGKPRAGHDHGPHTWLVRSDDEWDVELALAGRTVRRLRKRLEQLGLIDCQTLVDDGIRCTHIRRLYDDAEPSTIRPETADGRGSTIRPEVAGASATSDRVHPPLQAVSRARTSLPLRGEERPERKDRDTSPLLLRARAAEPEAEERRRTTRGRQLLDAIGAKLATHHPEVVVARFYAPWDAGCRTLLARHLADLEHGGWPADTLAVELAGIVYEPDRLNSIAGLILGRARELEPHPVAVDRRAAFDAPTRDEIAEQHLTAEQRIASAARHGANLSLLAFATAQVAAILGDAYAGPDQADELAAALDAAGIEHAVTLGAPA